MAYGVVKIIPASQHTEFTLGDTANAFPTIKVLNPNDGVIYVARNRDCLNNTYGQWDWKVPSQSYAMLPGPFASVGMFYLDQSGAGRPGEISVYASQQQLDDPAFVSIGRALSVLGSTLDVTESPQPSNPGVGVGRIWIDANGDLHVLQSTGTDKQWLHYGSQIDGGGFLSGPIHAPVIAGGVIGNAQLAAGAAQANLLGSDFSVRRTAQPTVGVVNMGTLAYLMYDGANWVVNPLANAAFILADGTVTWNKIANNTVTRVAYSGDLASDIWSNTALGAGRNGMSGYPIAVSADESTDYWIIILNACAQLSPVATTSQVGWDLAFDNVLYRKGSRQTVVAGTNQLVSSTTVFYHPGGWGGTHQFGPWFYTSSAQANGAYLRAASQPDNEFLHMTILEVRK